MPRDLIEKTNTFQANSAAPIGTLILSAALTLPGLHNAAHAETPPENGSISLRYLEYSESQPGLDRIKVRSPSLSLVAPVAGEWAVEASLVSDHVSGASPRYHTVVTSASRMSDSRNAADIRVTRYFSDGSLSVGAAFSNEHDYLSRALSVTGTVTSGNKNTTWTFGVGAANDAINPTNQAVINEKKNTWDLMAGVTQVLTPQDIAQINLGLSVGRGYYSDPYKIFDNRPRGRTTRTVLLGWNHHFKNTDGTGRLSYRYYSDTFAIKAHTFSLEYVQPFADGWTVVPSLRMYSQSAASFYYGTNYSSTLGEPFPEGYLFGANQFWSPDQRLAAFGARTFGIKLAKKFARDWTIDIKFENYEQKSSMRWFGSGSPGLAPLTARNIQIGVTRDF